MTTITIGADTPAMCHYTEEQEGLRRRCMLDEHHEGEHEPGPWWDVSQRATITISKRTT